MSDLIHEIDFESEVLSKEEIQKAIDIMLDHSDLENPPNLNDVTRQVTNDPNKTGRNKEGREIKRLYEQFDFKVRKAHEYQKRKHPLSENKQKAVDNNLNRFKGKPLQLVRFVFENESLTNLSKEYLAVQEYVNEVHKTPLKGSDRKSVDTSDWDETEFYEPPTTPLMALRQLRKYVPSCPIIEDDLKKSRIEYSMSKLRDYLQDRHFLHKVNTPSLSNSDRDLLLSTFIKQVYDKPDLTEEEREQYLSVCTETVYSNGLMSQINLFNERINSIQEDGEGNFRMGYVEMNKTLQDSYDKAQKRIKELIKGLTQTRAKKLENKREEIMSLTQLVVFTMEEKTRKRLAAVAQARREELKKGYKKMNDCDALIAEVWGGGSEDEILNG